MFPTRLAHQLALETEQRLPPGLVAPGSVSVAHFHLVQQERYVTQIACESELRATTVLAVVSDPSYLIAVQGAEWTIPLTSFNIGELLSTTQLERSDWFVIILVSSTVFMVEEFRKQFLSKGIFRVRTSRRT